MTSFILCMLNRRKARRVATTNSVSISIHENEQDAGTEQSLQRPFVPAVVYETTQGLSREIIKITVQG